MPLQNLLARKHIISYCHDPFRAAYEIDQNNAIHEQLREEAKRAEKWHKERLIRAIRQIKEEHRKKVEILDK